MEHEKTSTVDELLTERTRYSTPHAALYTPWVELYDSQNSSTASISPSGAIAGVIAKSEIDNGADAAPAGISINGLSGLNTYYTDEEVNLLTANNLNPLRFFTPADYKVWGARTMSDNADTRYVPVQRYGSQLELSIRLGTAWVIAEANTEPFWTTLETQIQTFLHEEWLRGALVGAAPEEAYYAKCDLTTMSAEDIIAGRTICTWGVSLIRPAEFSAFTLIHERTPGPVDTEFPAGYTLRTTETTAGTLNEPALALQIDNAEIGSRYKYYIGSTGGPEVLYSEGEVTVGFFSITEGRIASLSSGDIHVYLSLTDSSGNLGPWVSPTKENNFNWLMFLPTIIKQEKK
ncbi:MAG: phage tail sheath subtilisin-like domain-containing protein [Desulfobulbaceae bacterium]|nr:phage tail sheath subtilisin-like domain-containing protein [Desulfobulbaceae bacterium]